jgi:PTS system ascorbate-specific IIB component
MSQRPDPLTVLAVCGLGMGTSLILRMTCETVFTRLGVAARVDNTDLSAAKSMSPDVLVGQGMHMADLEGVATVNVVVDDFIDDAALEARLRPALEEAGWL